MTAISGNPFFNCSALESFTGSNPFISADGHCLINSNGELLSYTLAATTGSYQVPDGVTQINTNAMAHAKFSSVSFPSTVTTIKNMALVWCFSLESVTIPASVTSIGNGAFSRGEVLKSVTMLGTTPPSLGTEVFLPTNGVVFLAGGKIYVPRAAYSNYYTAEDWAEYKDFLYKSD